MSEMSTCSICGSTTATTNLVGDQCVECTQAQARPPSSAPRVDGFRLLRRLGEGGQGQVWQAIRLKDNRKVAVKLLRPDRLEAHHRARFEQEQRTLALIDHPNIVKMLDHGELDGGTLWLAVEYISGRSLNEYVHELVGAKLGKATVPGPFPVRDVLNVFIEVCAAVQAAHRAGVIHRDLKPANIVVDDDGRPHLLDFGLARQPEVHSPDAVTITGEFFGSPAWSSPEQVERRPGQIDVRTDVYSLGVMLYHLLTGTFPYDVNRGPAEVFDAIRHDDPIPPRTLVKWIDKDLQAILLTALAKERDRRYQSAGELMEDLQRYLHGDPVVARGDSQIYALRKLIHRHRVLVGSACVVFVLSVVSAVVMSILRADALEAKARAQDIQHRAEESEAETKRLLAQSRLDAARLATQRGDWQTALKHYDAALTEGDPDAIELRLGRVEAWTGMNVVDDAANELKMLAAVVPGTPYEGEWLLWRAEIALTSDLEPQSAADLIDAAIAKGLRRPADQAYARGLQAARSLDARDSFRQALREDPFHHRANQLLALTLLLLGQLDEAADRARTAELLSPDSPNPRILQALIYALQDDSEQARAHLGSIALLVPSDAVPMLYWVAAVLTEINPVHAFMADPTAYQRIVISAAPMLLGAAAAGAGQADERVLGAAAEFQIRYPPNMEGPRRLINAMGMLIGGDYEGGLSELSIAADLHPEGLVHLLRARVFSRLGRIPEAIDEYEKAVTLPSMIDIRSYALTAGAADAWNEAVQRGEDANGTLRPKAVDMLRQRLDLGDMYDWEYSILAGIAIGAEEDELARFIVADWLHQGTDDPKATQYLAQVHYVAGAYQEAFEAAGRALAASPDDELMRRIRKESGEKLDMPDHPDPQAKQEGESGAKP